MTRLNPEFVKNCWLQLSPHRLLVTPLVIGMAVALIAVLVDHANLGNVLDVWLVTGAFALACLGGVYVSASSMIAEFADNTWDQQRLSPLSPWSLTWGKVIGGAVYMWYGTLILLLLFLAVPLLLSTEFGWRHHLQVVAGLIGLALFSQALGLLTVISAANAPDRLLRYRRNYGVALVILVALLGSTLWRTFLGDTGQPGTVDYWGRRPSTVQFWLISVWLFAGWALLGAYRLMREQMQFQNGPWCWLAFNLFMIGYVAGFVTENRHDDWRLQTIIWIAFGIALGLCYAILLLQPTGPMALRLLARAVAAGRWSTALGRLPPWAVSYLLAACVLPINAIVGIGPVPELPDDTLMVALLLFAARDLGLFVGFTLGDRPQRALVTSVVYLSLLYGLLPALLNAAGATAVIGLFWPLSGFGEIHLWPVAVELVAVAVWLRVRLVASRRRVSA